MSIFFTIFSAMSGPILGKEAAIFFYQTTEDEAFSLTARDAQTRIAELGKVYNVVYHRVNSIFDAKELAEKTLAEFGRKFVHMEFAGHGDETKLIFNQNVPGGIISPESEKGKEELKTLIEMVADNGIIVSQSCGNGSTKLKQKNVLEYLADFTKPGQRAFIHLANKDFGCLIKFRGMIDSSLMDFALKFSEQASPYLKELGLTASDAIQFFIEHQIKRVSLNSFGDEITDEMINRLVSIKGLTYIDISKCRNVSLEYIESVTEWYPSIKINFPRLLLRDLKQIREEFPNMPIIDPEFWESLGLAFALTKNS